MVQATSTDESLLGAIVSLVWSFRDLAMECGVPGEPGDRTILRLMAIVQRSATPPRLSEVADAVGLDLSTTSRHVATLGKDGFIERIEDAHDRRAFRLRLTPAGMKLLIQVRDSRTKAISGALASWDDAEKLAASEILHRIAQEIDPKRETNRETNRATDRATNRESKNK
jgi:hypothetical protein